MMGTRAALIVAAYDFDDPKFQQLRAPAKDAEALSEVLADADIGGFDVETLINEPSGHVNQEIEGFFSDRTPDDLLLLYFTCHGVKDPNGRLYFAMANTRFPRLRSTGVPASFVSEQMESSRARRIALLLDCCYSGAFLKGLRARASEEVDVSEQFEGRGRAVITASRATEYAFEAEELAADKGKPSIFTSAIVRGLVTGSADRDENGLVTIDELYDYIYDEVKGKVAGQTPGRWVDVEGDLVIARNPNPPVRPAELPVELQNAVHSESALQRLGAVSVLKTWIEQGSEGEALRATEVLGVLAEDPDVRVNAAARLALRTTVAPEKGPPTPPEPRPPIVVQPPQPQPPPSPPEEERTPLPPRPAEVGDIDTAPPKRPPPERPGPADRSSPLPPDRTSRRVRTAGWLGLAGTTASLLAEALPYEGGYDWAGIDRHVHEAQRLANIFVALLVAAASAQLLRSSRRGTNAGWLLVGTVPAILAAPLFYWGPFFRTGTRAYFSDGGSGLAYYALAAGSILIAAAALVVVSSGGSPAMSPPRRRWHPAPLPLLALLATVLSASWAALAFGRPIALEYFGGYGTRYTNVFVVAVVLVGFLAATLWRGTTGPSENSAGQSRKAVAIGALYAITALVYLLAHSGEGTARGELVLYRASASVFVVGSVFLLSYGARSLSGRPASLAVGGLAATAAAAVVDPMLRAGDYDLELPRAAMLAALVGALALAAWLWRSEPDHVEPVAADR